MSDRRLRRFGAAAGAAYVLLQLLAQTLIQVGGVEPPFSAMPEAAVAFFQSRDATLYAIGDAVSVLAGIALLWFIGVVWRESSRVEGDPAWVSMVGFGAGVLTVAVSAIGTIGWPLAMFRRDQGFDPLLAQFQFDLSNVGFAGAWVTLAVFVAATTVIAARGRLFPRWLIWFGGVTAFGLVLARPIWTSPVVFVVFIASWVWLIAVSVSLFRRVGREAIIG